MHLQGLQISRFQTAARMWNVKMHKLSIQYSENNNMIQETIEKYKWYIEKDWKKLKSSTFTYNQILSI